jgi:hypothetical protein
MPHVERLPHKHPLYSEGLGPVRFDPRGMVREPA